MNVRVYWNLNKDCVSIQDAKTRRVIGYAARVLVSDVSFTVSESGRRRTIETNHRNVHAYACGTLTAADWIENKSESAIAWTPRDTETAARIQSRGDRVSYNPFKGAAFTVAGRAIANASELYLTGDTKAECFI